MSTQASSITSTAVPAPVPSEPDLNRGDFLPDLCNVKTLMVLVVLGELIAFTVSLVAVGTDIFSSSYFGMTSFLLQWVTLTSAAALCGMRQWLNRSPTLVAGTVSYSVVLIATLIFTLSGSLFFASLGTDALAERLIINLILAAVIAGIGLRYCYIQQQLYNQQQAELMARVQALQARIRPHFLFNSLNSIISLIHIDPDKAEKMVLDLSSLFRSSLKQEGMVPLGQEINLCKKFISVEQMRLGDRLEVRWSGEENVQLQKAKIPSLMLQPIIENAIYHGVQPITEGGRVDVDISGDEQSVRCKITNPVSDKLDTSIGAHEGNGMALQNIERRLRAYFGDTARLEVEESPTLYSVTISYPNRKE